jgi:hypothetical protein
MEVLKSYFKRLIAVKEIYCEPLRPAVRRDFFLQLLHFHLHIAPIYLIVRVRELLPLIDLIGNAIPRFQNFSSELLPSLRRSARVRPIVVQAIIYKETGRVLGPVLLVRVVDSYKRVVCQHLGIVLIRERILLLHIELHPFVFDQLVELLCRHERVGGDAGLLRFLLENRNWRAGMSEVKIWSLVVEQIVLQALFDLRYLLLQLLDTPRPLLLPGPRPRSVKRGMYLSALQ